MTRLQDARWTLLAFVALGVSLEGPSRAIAQPVVGTANPSGTISLSGGSTPFFVAGNPQSLNTTFSYQGLTVSAMAQNAYAFGSTYQAAEASETASISGALSGGYNNSELLLTTTSNLSGMAFGPAPPDGVNYYYNIGPTEVLIQGVLEPGDRADVEFAARWLGYGDYAYGFFGFSQIYYNTSNSPLNIFALLQYPGVFLGDWETVREENDFVGFIQSTLTIDLRRYPDSSSGESWVQIDPSFGLSETITSPAPEPSSVILSALGALGIVAYSASRRTQRTARKEKIGKEPLT